MNEFLQKIDIKAEAGLCQMTLGGARAFLEDIRTMIANPESPWRPMQDAPTSGRAIWVAIKTGAFVYTFEAAYLGGKWCTGADCDGEMLCWMPKIRIPAEFLPYEPEYNPENKTIRCEGPTRKYLEPMFTSAVPSRPPQMSEEERQRRLNSNPDNEYDGL